MEKQKKLWDNYRVIGELKKSDKIKFVIGAGIRDGVKYINVREFYFRQKDQTWNPGKDGITIPLCVPVESGATFLRPYVQFAGLLADAAEALETMPLADEEHAVYYTVKEKK